MYVALHELSHIACPEIGHPPLFRDVFAFLTKNAKEMGLYEEIDFNINPHEYCGLIINTGS